MSVGSDERLKTKVEESTCLVYTGLIVDYYQSIKRELETRPIYDCLFIMNRWSEYTKHQQKKNRWREYMIVDVADSDFFPSKKKIAPI